LNDSRELGVRRIGRPSVAMSRVSCSERPLLVGWWLVATEGNQFRLHEFDEAKGGFRPVLEMTNPGDLFVGKNET
jgi:hypothetical protein